MSAIKSSINCSGVSKSIGLFAIVLMAVVALWMFVVVADQAPAWNAVEEPILERMRTTFYRNWKSPNHNFENRSIIKIETMTVDQERIHVGTLANTEIVVNDLP
jgi:hypothetical protein